jgi:drug/metabolite transporter (DMT)-like permease
MTEGQKGNAIIIFEGLIWSLFPIVTILGLRGISSIVGLFWATSFSALFFLAIVIFRNKWQELKNWQVWKYSFGVAIFIGVIYYGLYFYGLTMTVSANGAIVALFEVVTSYIFFQVIHRELMPKKYILGIIFATLGALLIFIPKFGHFHSGDIFILLATFAAPFGNWYQQKARNIASSEIIMLMRNIITIPFLFVLAILLGASPLVRPLGNAFWWLLLNGVFIFGLSKFLWVEGIHRMSVTKALAINSLAPFFTIIFAWLLIGDSPTLTQLLSLPLLVVGVFLLTNVKFSGILFFQKKKLP